MCLCIIVFSGKCPQQLIYYAFYVSTPLSYACILVIKYEFNVNVKI